MSSHSELTSLDELFDRFQNGDRRALSRLLTFVTRHQSVSEIRDRLSETMRHREREPEEHRPKPRSRVVALTGSGGVGKSSLTGRLVAWLRDRGETVGVLACDPESSLTGGAVLGDRVRMTERPGDSGVFVRSLATASGHQAIAAHLDLMIDLLAGFGFDKVLVETVGAGQGDVAVRRWVDVLVLLVQPESGDDLQWEKAGVLELADVVAVNKSDLPGADRIVAQIKDQLALGRSPQTSSNDVAVVATSAARNEGIEELWDAIHACPGRRTAANKFEHELWERAELRMSEVARRHSEQVRSIVERWVSGDWSESRAVDELLRLCLRDRSSN